MATVTRVLFLDDDPARAERFRYMHPGAVWVQTANECIALLAEPWDEVHLDHDLGGETFVDHERDDCGMAIVRWLCAEPREHLRAARFIIHSHNPNAACMMAFQLEASGYQAEALPFGSMDPAPRPARPRAIGQAPLLRRFLNWFSGRPNLPGPLR